MELVYRRSEMQDYKKFYERFCKDTRIEEDMDMCQYENLHYEVDLLDEYLLGCRELDIHLKFVGFDRENMRPDKDYDDYEWSLIFRVLERFVRDFPNSTIEFVE